MVKVLANGEPIFEYQGVKYRGLTESHADRIDTDLFELKKLQEAMPLCLKETGQLRGALETATQQAKVADEQRSIQKQIADNWKTMFDDEKELRTAAEKFIHRGRVASFFEKPVMQLVFKAGIPIVQAIVTAKR